MKPNSILVLAGIAVVSVGAALFAVIDRADQFATESSGVPMFSDLADQSNIVAKIIVQTKDEKVAIEKGKDQWILPAKDNYLVNIGKVRRLVAGVAGLRLMEQMTDNPKKHAKLEVEDITQKEARSKLVEFQDAKGKTLAKVIVGKLELITSHANMPGLYVRRPDEKRSWRAQGEVIVPHSPENWLEGAILSVKKESVKRITYTDKDGKQKPFSLVRKESGLELTLEPKPKSGEVKKDKIKDIDDLLTDLELQDVRREGKIALKDNVRLIEVETFDGLVVKVEMIKLMDKYWARFTAAAKSGEDNAKVAKRAEEINQRVKGWIYEVIDWKGEKLMVSLKELVGKKEKKGS